MMQGIESFLLLPRRANTLAVLRICTGAMIAYIHLIWLWDLPAFFGPTALLTNELMRDLHAPLWKWTYLTSTDSMVVAAIHSGLAAISGALMAAGCLSRISVPMAWILTLLTAHRLAPLLFGLDQVVLMLAMYLCVAHSGDVWSVDRWLQSRRRRRETGSMDEPAPMRWNNTLSMRLIQLHLCVIYLFGGLGKLRGWMWWDGTAMWYSAAAYEYQSLPLTWIGSFPILGAMATHATLFWEVFYAALVWPRRTRPWVLAMAMMVHAGIALFLGMITFGVMMMIANLAFVEPEWWASCRQRLGVGHDTFPTNRTA